MTFESLQSRPVSSIDAEIEVPGDKSISHRALLLASIARGNTHIQNLAPGIDVQTTIECLRSCGVNITVTGPTDCLVHGLSGASAFSEPVEALFCGNSGTTVRLLAGLLSGFPGSVTLIGDSSLSSRPMKRIVTPLREMGVFAEGAEHGSRLPLTLKGKLCLKSGVFVLPLASAQVKSCILLAALSADGEVIIEEPCQTRDHTERMLQYFGCNCTVAGNRISLVPSAKPLTARAILIPGDPSTAAFLLAATAIQPGGKIKIHNLSLNPTRIEFLKLLGEMGAEVDIEPMGEHANEPYGTVRLMGKPLCGCDISREQVSLLIDEFPALAVCMAAATGVSTVRGALELRHKESDRISCLAQEVRRFGVSVEEFSDGYSIQGRSFWVNPAVADSYNDHRMAMMLMTFGSRLRESFQITGGQAVSVSCPGFPELLASLCAPTVAVSDRNNL